MIPNQAKVSFSGWYSFLAGRGKKGAGQNYAVWKM